MAAPNSVDDLERAFLLPYVEAIVPAAKLLSLADLRYKFYLGISEGTIVIGGGGSGGGPGNDNTVVTALHSFGSGTSDIASGGITYTRTRNLVIASINVGFNSAKGAGSVLPLNSAPEGFTTTGLFFGQAFSEGNPLQISVDTNGIAFTFGEGYAAEEFIQGSVVYTTTDPFPDEPV